MKTETKISLSFFFKRATDIFGAAIGLILFSPLCALIAVSIILTMGVPVLFRQQRPGLDSRPFEMYKFRTMRHVREGENPYYSDQDRMTKLGRFLRKMSLDELPEFWNVLKGDMSLVGPRPLLMEYIDKYTRTQLRRHDVKPGITGWAQVNGRTALATSKKLEMDVWYVDNRSWWLDCKILMLTIYKVLIPKESFLEQDHETIDDLGFLDKDNKNNDA